MQQALYCRADGADKSKQVLQAGCGRLKAFVWRVFSGRRDSAGQERPERPFKYRIRCCFYAACIV